MMPKRFGVLFRLGDFNNFSFPSFDWVNGLHGRIFSDLNRIKNFFGGNFITQCTELFRSDAPASPDSADVFLQCSLPPGRKPRQIEQNPLRYLPLIWVRRASTQSFNDIETG
jgi:hypothetical protein